MLAISLERQKELAHNQYLKTAKVIVEKKQRTFKEMSKDPGPGNHPAPHRDSLKPSVLAGTQDFSDFFEPDFIKYSTAQHLRQVMLTPNNKTVDTFRD